MTPSENSARRQSSPESRIAQSKAENLLGDLFGLLQKIGAAETLLACPSAVFPAGHISSVAGLIRFLEAYLDQVLLPLELPAIAKAHGHARRGELRELIALDQKIALATRPAPFTSASRAIGSTQLQRLRPLRDERTLQRYLTAVEAGQAHGWHTLVYGLTLAVYSFPLRQGLLHYARETISALAGAAAAPANLTVTAAMLEDLLARLPDALEKVIPACDIPFPSAAEK